MNEFSSLPATEHSLPETAPRPQDEIKSTVEKVLADLKPQAEQLWEQGKKYAEQNPGKALLGAVGIGFVLGYLFRN